MIFSLARRKCSSASLPRFGDEVDDFFDCGLVAGKNVFHELNKCGVADGGELVEDGEPAGMRFAQKPATATVREEDVKLVSEKLDAVVLFAKPCADLGKRICPRLPAHLEEQGLA